MGRLEDLDSPAGKAAQKHRHSSDLDPREGDSTTVCMDARHMGLGGINSWGALPLPEYLVPLEPLELAITLEPLPYLESGTDLSEAIRRGA